MEQSKRVSKEPRATNKRQRTTAGDDNDKATEHPPSAFKTNTSSSKQAQPAAPASSTTTRRPFFGVIDNVSSFSGIIEGPYNFGFAISITVDRQTFKGVVYKSNSEPNHETTSLDEEVMVNFATSVHAANSAGSRVASSAIKAKTNTSQEEVRLPDITTFHFQDSRHGIHEAPRSQDSPRSSHPPHTPHDVPRTPLTSHDSPSPRDDHNSDADDHYQAAAPPTPSQSSHPPHLPHSHSNGFHQQSPSSSSTSFSHASHHADDQLPAIHSVLQGMTNLSPTPSQSHHASPGPSSVASPPPLPPQPQLQRQKQRQKKRQEKKLMELQQQQPARYQSLLDRERSKIPLLGDESLVHAGMEILQHMEEQKH